MMEYICIALYLLGAYQAKEMIDIVCEDRGHEYHPGTKTFACLVWPLVTMFVFSSRMVGK